MYATKTIRRGRFVLHSWKKITIVLAYTIAILIIYQQGIVERGIPVAVPAMLGTALSILLAFRTNSAYARWWEARKIWGAIVNDSRTLARQVIWFFRCPEGGDAAAMRALQVEMVHRQIGWNYTLANSLRGLNPFPGMAGTVAESEQAALRGQANRPNAMLHTQTGCLREALDAEYVDGFRFQPIEDTLKRFSDHMGKCERIKNTVFPPHYSFFVARIIWLFFLLLPLGLVGELEWAMLPVAFFTAIVFWLLETLGQLLEDPFENQLMDTPMTALSRTIEINLRQQLGETDLPEKLEPVDGVLM